MRKITEESIRAFQHDQKFGKSNTTVVVNENTTKLFLFGNLIAEKRDGRTFITNADFFTNTTKERLNGLPNVHIVQQAGQWYLNGKKWNGKWTEV